MILDLFAGPGGWDEGMRSIGVTDVVGLEWDEAACATRAAAGHRTIRCDVAEYPVEPFMGRVRGLIASPPCQAWSMAGKGAGRKEVDRVHAAVELCRNGWNPEVLAWPWDDARTPLILQPLRWAWALRPKWVACEQVPPALGVWQHVADVFRSWGYSADARVLCAADYGVPQTRDRAFLIATKGALRWPEPTHAEKPEPSLFGASRKPWVTMAAALRWGPTTVRLRTNQRPPGMDGEYYSRSVDRPAPHLTSNTDSYKWVFERPAPTVSGSFSPHVIANPTGRRQGGELVSRQDTPGSVNVTIEEAAVLQGLPAAYPFRGNKSEQFAQVGNVVCPAVAAALVACLNATPNRAAA